MVTKPIEHSNEYGINLSGPLVPLGKWKEKVFYFANYNGFRYTSGTPTPMTMPTAAQMGGDFSAAGLAPIYDPASQAACTAHQTNGYVCRYQYGYTAPPLATTKGPTGAGVLTGALNVIPSAQIPTWVKNMQALLPTTGVSSALQNNYMSANPTGLVNWSHTERIDYLVNSKDTLSFVAAIGRQASSVPVGQNTAGRNVGPVPFNYGQAYAPKTAVGIIEETHVFTSHLVNQVKWGFARYNGPTFNPDQAPAYAATAMGLSNLPAGQAQQTFPIVTFAGSNNPTNWGGTTANATIANNYTVLDNVQWSFGKHSFTFGGQLSWMQYNTYSATGGGTTPLTLAAAVAETAGLTGTSATAFTVATGTGQSYASFLIGQIDKGSLTDYSYHPGYSARFRPISPYIQDNWKVTPKLTLDLGLRYDFYPSLREKNNAASFFDPNLSNPVTGLLGALNYTGSGVNSCNCSTPVTSNYMKNFGPRVGLAYQMGPKTVIRSSYGVMFSHGDAVGGLASTLGTLGFSGAMNGASSNSVTTMTNLLAGGSGALPAYTPAAGSGSGNGMGTGYAYSAALGSTYTGAPNGVTYDDPYLGSRAPEYINWSFGIQRQVTNALALTATYVGSEGHFLQLDSLNARGLQANQMDPKYLYLGSKLADKGATVATDCALAANNLASNPNCSSSTAVSLFANSKVNQSLSQFLKPYPFSSPSDSFGYVGNAHYNGLQLMANMRAWHGLTVNANFTWSRSIDDGGTFRSGYAIPAGTLANHPTMSYKADEIERTVSTSNQPLHFVLTSVWAMPFGKTVFADKQLERTILGGFKFSGVFQEYSGSPLAITSTSCQTNPSTSTCVPTINPNYSGPARQNGKWGKHLSAIPTDANFYGNVSYIVPSIGGKDKTTGATVTPVSGPFISPVAPTTPANQVSVLSQVTGVTGAYDYTFGDAARTAPYGITGPGNYQLDLSMVRSFPLHITAASKLNFRAEWYNITNKTQFSVASTVLGNASFGQVTQSTAYNRKAAQFSARIDF
jgi:hypothetical protein